MTRSEPVAGRLGVVGVGCLLLGLAGVTFPEPPAAVVGVSTLVKGGGVPTRVGGGVLTSDGVLAKDGVAVEVPVCNFNFFPTGVLECVG